MHMAIQLQLKTLPLACILCNGLLQDVIRGQHDICWDCSHHNQRCHLTCWGGQPHRSWVGWRRWRQ